MIIKQQPKELDRKPLISEKDPRKGDAEVYMGRVIVEFWCEEAEECKEPAFAWSVDDPDQPDEELCLSMISGANFSSGWGPAIPVNESLLVKFGGQVTTKKGTT